MIYVDASVLLARILSEATGPPEPFWDQDLVTSRLTEFELTVTLNARSDAEAALLGARELLDRMSIVELVPHVLKRALKPFPSRVRTLDALHLATAHFLMELGTVSALATFDKRMADVGEAIGLKPAQLA